MAGPLDQFVQQVKQRQGTFDPTVRRGSLIWFKYPVSQGQDRYQINDPTPLVVVTDIWPSVLRGVNLHYLTMPYITTMIQNCGNGGYSYSNVKADRYIANAFRMYYRKGMSGIQKVDSNSLLSMNEVNRQAKLLTPTELEAMRQQVQKQIQSVLQGKQTDLNQIEQSNLANWKAQNPTVNPTNPASPTTPVTPTVMPGPTPTNFPQG